MTKLFQKAERHQAFLKMAFTGPSGAGKTFSALLLAHGLGKKIAVIDTENRSASLYADAVVNDVALKFDVLEISPPYTFEKYQTAIKAALIEGYDVLVIDSITHLWKGEGGLLEQKEALDRRPGSNSYTNWGSISKLHSKFISELLNSDIHLIATMRSKQDYILSENEKGKQVPRKVGLAPEQRDGMEYEFAVVLDLQMDHSVEASKDRTSLFDGKVFVPTIQTGRELHEWLNSGKPFVPRPVPVTKDDYSVLKNTMVQFNWEPNDCAAYTSAVFGKTSSLELNKEEFQKLLSFIAANPKKADAEDLPPKAVMTVKAKGEGDSGHA